MCFKTAVFVAHRDTWRFHDGSELLLITMFTLVFIVNVPHYTVQLYDQQTFTQIAGTSPLSKGHGNFAITACMARKCRMLL
jgi:hypothetical protein